jgi:hypothetical protein
MRLNLKGLYIQEPNRSSHKQQRNHWDNIYLVNPPVAENPESIRNTIMLLKHKLGLVSV